MNEFNLVSFSTNDCGFVKIPEGKVVYLSYPFKKSKTFETKESSEKYLSSLSKHDVFYDCDLYFKTIGDAIKYIKNINVEDSKAKGMFTDSKESRMQLLNYMSADDLRNFFNKFQRGIKSGRKKVLLGAIDFLQKYKSFEFDKKFPELSGLETTLEKSVKDKQD